MITDTPATSTYQQVQPYLFTVAYRMTGSASESEDLVHDAWIRYLDAGSPPVDSIRAWLTKVVSRLALDYLKSARVKREQYAGTWLPEPVLTGAVLDGPEATVERREEVSIAFLMLLDHLNPEQRVVYVLREVLALPYDEIGEHVGKSAAACRQIYHRAQLRLADERRPAIAPDAEHRALVERFLETVQAGDVTGLAALLTEDVAVMGDAGPTRPAPKRPIAGVSEVSRVASGYISAALARHVTMRFAVVDLNGAPAVVATDAGRLEAVLVFDVRDGGIAALRGVQDPAKLAWLAREMDLLPPAGLG